MFPFSNNFIILDKHFAKKIKEKKKGKKKESAVLLVES